MKVAERERALNIYRQARVETASPAGLVLTLMDACLIDMKKAMNCISEKDYAGANAGLLHAQDITYELRGALDLSMGSVALGLDTLYRFVSSSLLQANLKKETKPLDDALKAMTQVRDMWKEAVINHG